MPRTVPPAQQADREACLAAHPCNGCATEALQVPMTATGFTQWYRKQTNPRPSLPCSKHRGRRTVSHVDRHGDPKPIAGMERDAYVLWLQEELRKERSEVNRLRKYLESANKSFQKALERPADVARTLPPSPYVSPRPITAVDVKPERKVARRGYEANDDVDDDFDPTTPLSESEQKVLTTAWHLGGVVSTKQLADLLPRRTGYVSSRRLVRRGMLIGRLNLTNGLDVRSTLYALTDKGKEATRPLLPLHDLQLLQEKATPT